MFSSVVGQEETFSMVAVDFRFSAFVVIQSMTKIGHLEGCWLSAFLEGELVLSTRCGLSG